MRQSATATIVGPGKGCGSACSRRWRKKGGPDTVADRGCDSRAILKRIADHGSCPHIPTQRDRREQRSASHHLYRQRNLVERFFNKLKHFRGIATRHHKLAGNFLAAIALACIRLWIKTNEYTT